MSLRKILCISKNVSCRAIKISNTLTINNKRFCLPCKISRYYSTNNIVDKNTSVKTGSPSLIGQLFPQTSLNSQDSQEIEKQQKRLEKESKDSSEENAKTWRRTKIGFAVFGASMTIMGTMAIYEMGTPKRDENGEVIIDEFSQMSPLPQYLKRAWKELTFYEKMIKEPSREKLLPDTLPPPYQPPYTLVLEFTDVLVHPDWSYQTGWRFKKRPGLDAFLEAMSSTAYEVVIFTTENAMMIWPVIDKLDPNHNRIAYKLFRDSTHFMDGVHVKNLDCLNRDLSKVIVIDWNKQCTKYHRDNALIIPKWNGADDDTTLIDLTSLLQTIATSNVDDVREVLMYYSQFEDPIAAFRDNQRKLMEQLEEQEREAKSNAPPITNKWSKTFLRN